MPNYMEDCLDMPLREALQIMQERITRRTHYFGVRALKSPLDYWVYQEILFAEKPDVIVEIGNASGGSTLALAHLCDLLGGGRVIGIDINHARVPAVVKEHPRITLLTQDACAAYDTVRQSIRPEETVLVIEDSSHTYENTLKVLRTYAPLIRKGRHMIVEDSICHHGLDVGPKPGPYEAIQTFVGERKDFVVDRGMEAFLITWNPKGYLRRVA